MKVHLYAFRPVEAGSEKQTESILTYENGQRIAEVETGVVYRDWAAAAEATSKKNVQLAREVIAR